MKLVPPQWEPRIVPVLLLLLLVGVGGARLLETARHGWIPSAHNEERWFEWAWGRPAERALIPNPFRVDPNRLGLEADEEVFLVVEDPGVRAPWLRVLAQYALPGQRLIGAGDVEAARDVPPDVRRLHLDGPDRPLVAAVSPAVGPSTLARLGALAAGLGATLLLGAVFLRRGRRAWRRRPATEPVLAFAVGAVPYTLLAVLCLGVGLSGAWIPVGALALAVGCVVWQRRHESPPEVASTGPRRSWADAVWIFLAGVFTVRILIAPLWSWDHLAIWGAKARRIAAAGLSSDVLAPGSGDAFVYTTPHYPFGLPLFETAVASGLVPGGWLFRVLHLAWGLGLLILVRRAARSLGASRLAAAGAAAFAASSPLWMDTESLGLAEMPVAFWGLAAVTLAFDPRERARGRAWPAALALGFLIWIKQEAWILVALLGGLLWWLAPGKRRRTLPAVVAALASGAALVQLWIGQEGLSFFAGDPLDRVWNRLPRAPEILAAAGAKLLEPEWIGFWFLLAGGLGIAAVSGWRRHRVALALGAVVLVQLAVYAGVYFASYVPPERHIDSSFFRIVAALVPLGAVALAAAWGRLGEPTGTLGAQEASDASSGVDVSGSASSASSGESSSLSPTFLA